MSPRAIGENETDGSTVLLGIKSLQLDARSQHLAVVSQAIVAHQDCRDRAWQAAVISIVYLKSDSSLRFSS